MKRARILTIIGVGIALGCASFKPQPMEEISFRERAQTQRRSGLEVTVAVMTRDESRRAFGVDLASKNIQPVWVRIQNDSEVPYGFMLHSLDPSYYSAREAAYKSHFFGRGFTNKRMDEYFDSFGIDSGVEPRSSTEGFVFYVTVPVSSSSPAATLSGRPSSAPAGTRPSC
jgi:hypothetical protein